ncbi:MAG TPA: ABC-2 transporter permease [Usitatibacter sp.]|nr:ABC-2 transporter permease [Usitatibacter sp.]
MKALLALVRTDLTLYFSNRRALLITLAAPVLIAAFFGSVMGGTPGKRPARVPVAVVDLDQSAVTKAILASMRKDESFDIRDLPLPAAIEQVRAGKLRAAIVLPKDFGERAPRAMFRPGGKPEIEIHVDPSQSIAMALVKGLLAQHVMQEVSRAAFGGGAGGAKALEDARRALEADSRLPESDRRDYLELLDKVARIRERQAASGDKANGFGDGFQMPFTTAEREVTSGQSKYNGYSHSFAGMGVQFILFSGIDLGVAVLLMRRQGLWKRLRAAPVSRGLLLGSRIASGAVIALLLLAGIYAAGIAFFNVRVEGSWIGFWLVAAAFALLSSTFGLLIASVGRTPEATRGLAILATLLLVMLGGAWVPTFVFPEWMQAATLFVPTRWAVDGLEAMTWRGLGFEAALPAVAVMLTFSVAFGAIAVACFRWEE